MKVLAIQGSPHRGNTYDRVEAFRGALSRLGVSDFEHVALAEVDLRPCRGCFLCFARGEDSCPLDDDAAAIGRSMSEADAVVFATPVYSMHVSYLLKRFVDRFAFSFHRPRYFDKYAVGLAVSGGIGLTEALRYIRMFAGAWGFEYVGDLRYVDPPRNTALPRLRTEKDRTDEVARRLHDRMRTKPPRLLTADDHLMFHAMRAVYRRMEAFSPVDYAYWRDRGWLEPGASYFTRHARVGLIKSLYSRALSWLMGRAIDRQIAKLERPRSQDDGEAPNV